jgi:acyl-CoA synthetase (AMP-forming)/AMP-acid ligase II
MAETSDELAGRLMSVLRAAPDRAAIGSYRGPSTLAWRTRGRMLDDARAVAEGLRAAGLRRGEACVVAPVDEGEPDAAAIVAGCILAGCPPLAIPAFDGGLQGIAETLARALAITRGRVVLVASNNPAKVAAVAAMARAADQQVAVHGLDDVTAGYCKPDTGRAPAVHDDCRLMQLTSGTTGKSRVCMWSEAGIVACMRGIAASMRLGPGDGFFTWSGLHHTVGILNNLMLGLYHEVPTVFMSARRFALDPALWLRGLHESDATISSAPNFAFKFLADTVRPEELSGVSLARMRAFWNTGERVARASYDAFHDKLRPLGLRKGALRANYGSAENSGGATFSDVTADELIYETVERDSLERRGQAIRASGDPERHATIASVGAPWPGLDVRILGEDGAPLPDGAVGEIALATPSRFAGYCNDPDATAAVLVGGLLMTGDLGYRRDGQLFWIGRKTECIVVRGRKIDPSELLTVLEPVANLRGGAYVAFGVDDDASGTQRVIVMVELASRDGDPAQAAREVRRAILRGIGVAADDVVVLAPGTLVTTISGKRRHGYYKDLYLRGELAALRLGGR